MALSMKTTRLGIQIPDSMEPAFWVGCGLVVTLTLTGVFLYLRLNHLKNFGRHYALAKLKLYKLPADSPTRQRIEAAQRLFDKGWKMLKTDDPYACLSYFARAIEVDELGCRWRKQFEKRLENLGDLFTNPPKDDRDKYQSMLAEAYLVMLLHTVVSQQGGQNQELEEDFRVVKTRLGVCVALQPDNPMVYKLRADFMQRFGHLASKEELVADFKRAIQLAEEDETGKQLIGLSEGVSPKQQRRFLLAYCYHELGSLQQRLKEPEAAIDSYTKSVQYSEPDFLKLADSHFSLCILTLMKAKRVAEAEKASTLAKAVTHYKHGLKAEKAALVYLPHAENQVSRSLAKEMIKKFAKTKMA